jgi:hypothetical protein
MGGVECMVSINIIIKCHLEGIYACEQNFKPLEMDGSTNVFIGWSLFDMYAKRGSKKIWHEIITFFCDSKSYITMNKYIISIILRYDFGHISILM